jgi:hypothetical protein
MHHCLRLRRGFLNDILPVDWAVPGAPSLYEALQEYGATHQPLQIVWGAAPGWSDP